MSKKNMVRWDGERHWFRLSYAAKLSGKTKGDLLAMAHGDGILSQEDAKGEFWFERLAILALQAASSKVDAGRAVSKTARAKPKPKTAAQLERQWAKQAAELAKANPKRGGGVSVHYEKVLLSEISETNRKAKDEGPK